jgi:predicted RNase H-like nuclease (RuvC/YqgF family)
VSVDASVVISAIAIAVSVVLAVIMALSRYAVGTKDTETNRRFNEMQAQITAEAGKVYQQGERLHRDELETSRLQGEVNLSRAHHEGLEKKVDALHEDMVPRGEWESQMENLNKRLDQLFDEVRRTKVSSPSPGYRPPYRPAESDPQHPPAKRDPNR